MKPLGYPSTCPPNCTCLCCQEARKPRPYCEDCGKDECECPEQPDELTALRAEVTRLTGERDAATNAVKQLTAPVEVGGAVGGFIEDLSTQLTAMTAERDSLKALLLEIREDAEASRVILIDHLKEPVATVFWRMVEFRRAIDAALARGATP